ncbi:DNA polymerase III subunit epsilon [Candidatus Hoaglandella endobia]|nr:DNA polymerase III subunit epsilon [Candidatus Hoaglandella endobia]
MSNDITRQIILDTETTGINRLGIHYEKHRIIEIGAVEIVNRRLTGSQFHIYLKPNRLIDLEAFNVHGISDEFLADKPVFADVADEFLDFIRGSELVIHNAPFDIGFIDYELGMLGRGIAKINTFCLVTDSLQLARKIFPGKRNNLDALCDRYLINNSQRKLHSALYDAKILADVFLLMTGGQTLIPFDMVAQEQHEINSISIQRMNRAKTSLKVIYASNEEVLAHNQQLDLVQKKSGSCLWRRINS